MRVYVAGASKEPGRVRAAMDAVLAAGAEVTLDWLDAIEKAGASNEGLDDETRTLAAEADLEGVADADVVWVLAPEAQSAGCWVELGYALALRKLVLVSGPARVRCIFGALAHEYDEDGDVVVDLGELAAMRWERK
jgi:nucleoside 2-deoxyribosyltransferase